MKYKTIEQVTVNKIETYVKIMMSVTKSSQGHEMATTFEN